MQLTVRLIDAKFRGYISPEEYRRRLTFEKLNPNSKVTIEVPDENEF
jgi:hypothetical protein